MLVATLGVLGVIAAPRAMAAEIDDAMTPQFASQLRLCLRSSRASVVGEPVGRQRVDLNAACPEVAARLGTGPLPGMRGRWLGEDGSMTLRQLGDLLRLVEAAAEPKPFVGQLSSLRLRTIIDSLDPAARGELSTRTRIAHEVDVAVALMQQPGGYAGHGFAEQDRGDDVERCEAGQQQQGRQRGPVPHAQAGIEIFASKRHQKHQDRRARQ